jgi:hypothetical protein
MLVDNDFQEIYPEKKIYLFLEIGNELWFASIHVVQ